MLYFLDHASFRKPGCCGIGLQCPVSREKGTSSKGANLQVLVFWCTMPRASVGKWSKGQGGRALQVCEMELSSLKAELASVLVHLLQKPSDSLSPSPTRAGSSQSWPQDSRQRAVEETTSSLGAAVTSAPP